MDKKPGFTNLISIPGFLFAMSSRHDGNMKIHNSCPAGNKETINRREDFLRRSGISSGNVVSVNPIHGSNIEIVGENEKGGFIPETDGLITGGKDIFLSITVADCLPIALIHPPKEVFSLIHSGWKGLEKNIIKNSAKKLHENFGIAPGELIAYIGPGIGPCHFEVKEDFMQIFKGFHEAFRKKEGKFFADLKLIAKKQLERSGILPENISVSEVCTYCQSDTFFSFRKDGTKPVKAMMVVAGFSSHK